jgi:glyoxylase-like metal-dependent hydrolase (beta-lactamase superfamily II)
MLIQKINERISRIAVQLPRNPLRELNSYIVRGDERDLLIDTGFRLPESFSDLAEGIRALGIDMGRTDIFLTHCHADHTGNAKHIASNSSIIFVSAADKAIIDSMVEDKAKLRKRYGDRMVLYGFPRDEIERSLDVNPAIQNNETELFPMETIADGHVFDLGGVRLRAFCTPGHTPGHMCLSIDDDGILFTGDHVLFDITPNITSWPDMDDSLGSYMDSLRKVRGMDMRLALPGHRKSGSLAHRVDELLRHHASRLLEAHDIVRQFPDATCYDVASHMKWRISADDWESFPLSQKYFAVGEARSHLRHLELTRKIKIYSDGGTERCVSIAG